jgi:bifunctional non-homologous end joining protein LigD
MFCSLLCLRLLDAEGNDLRSKPLTFRKATLERSLKKSPLIRYTDYVVGEGNQLFSTVAKFGLEGIVGKKADSLYIGGRTKEWLKIKTRTGNEAMKRRIETWGR